MKILTLNNHYQLLLLMDCFLFHCSRSLIVSLDETTAELQATILATIYLQKNSLSTVFNRNKNTATSVHKPEKTSPSQVRIAGLTICFSTHVHQTDGGQGFHKNNNNNKYTDTGPAKVNTSLTARVQPATSCLRKRLLRLDDD